MNSAYDKVASAMAASDWFTEETTPDPTSIKPSGWRILIRPMVAKEVTKGGILLPDNAKDREALGVVTARVLAVGPLAYTREDMQGVEWCKPGDYILFAKFAGKRVEVEGVKLIILNDDEVLAVVTNPAGVKNRDY